MEKRLKPLPYITGTKVWRKDDGMEGTIERVGSLFGMPVNQYRSYYVRWKDGKLGYPSEHDFTTEKK
jgi:hypothetical protein